MAISLMASVVVVILNTVPALAFLVLTTGIYVLGVGRIRLIAICYGAIALMWLLSIGFIYPLHLLSEKIPLSDPASMLIPFMRTMIMINTILALALSSRIQLLLSALKSLHLPGWLYIPSAVVIRFVPTFIKDVRQIHETMRTRGYNLNPLFLLRHPLLTTRLLIAPMLFRTLRSADDLAVAAELKGIRIETGMTSYKPQHFGLLDIVAWVTAVFCLIVAFMLQKIIGNSILTGMF